LFEAEVEGLQGLTICIYHGSIGTEPGWRDLRGSADALLSAAAETAIEYPIGDAVWWDADGSGYVLREDDTYYLNREDGYGGLRRELGSN
jgi:hypothetical protein